MPLHFSLRVSPGDKPKIVISVSKKVSKKAVVRNLIKRRVKALMPSLLKELKPALYLISAKPGAEEIKGKELGSELRSLCKL